MSVTRELVIVCMCVCVFFLYIPAVCLDVEAFGLFSVCLSVSEVCGVSAMESLPPLLSAELRRELPSAPCRS